MKYITNDRILQNDSEPIRSLQDLRVYFLSYPEKNVKIIKISPKNVYIYRFAFNTKYINLIKNECALYYLKGNK